MAVYMHLEQIIENTEVQPLRGIGAQLPKIHEQPKPQWDAVEREVILKLRYLRAAWKHTASTEPELHELMKRDLYLPAMKRLAAFCSAIQEEEE